MINQQYVTICRSALDFDAPIITTLSEIAQIPYEQAEKFVSDNLTVIYNKEI